MPGTRTQKDTVALQTESEDSCGVRDGWGSSQPSQRPSTAWFFHGACLAKVRARGTQTLGRALPFGIREPSTSHLPLPAPNGSADVWPQNPPLPPSLGTWAGLSFSHLHARLGAPGGSSHPGVGPPLAIWGDFMAG